MIFNIIMYNIVSIQSLNNDRKIHSISIPRNNTISDLKYVIAKRLHVCQHHITIYTSPEMNDIYPQNTYIGTTKNLYMYIDYYDVKHYSWWNYYICCGRR